MIELIECTIYYWEVKSIFGNDLLDCENFETEKDADAWIEKKNKAVDELGVTSRFKTKKEQKCFKYRKRQEIIKG